MILPSWRDQLIGEFLIAGLVVLGADLSFTSFSFRTRLTNFPEWFGLDCCVWIVGMANG